MKENLYCVEYGMKKLSYYAKDSLNNMFFHKYLLQNEFIDFVNDKIQTKCNEDEELDKAIKYLNEESKKKDNIAINKSEQDKKLRKAYSTIRKKFKDCKLLDENKLVKEFRGVLDKKHKLYLPDDMMIYAIKDKVAAFQKVYLAGDGFKVSKRRLNEVRSLTSRIDIGSTGISSSIKLIHKNDKYYIELRDCGTNLIWDLLAKYYDSKTKQYKVRGIDENGNEIRYTRVVNKKKIRIRIYLNPKNILQKTIIDNPETRKSLSIVRTRKNGKYRYGLQIAYTGISPIFKTFELGNEDICVHIGTETISVVRVSDAKQLIMSFPKNKKELCERLAEINQYLDRSARATNPDCYDDKGVPLSRAERQEKDIHFSKSNRYKLAQKQVQEIYRKMASTRKTNNCSIARNILQEFNAKTMYIGSNQIKGWKVKRNRMSEKSYERLNKTDRCNKGYAKQVQECAPAQLTERLKYNITKAGGTYNQIKYFNYTMYNPFTEKYDVFTQLAQRFTRFDINTEWYLYNEHAVDFLNTVSSIQDNEGNVYYIQRDLFAAIKLKFIYAQEEKVDDKINIVYKFDNENFIKYFKTTFYPAHIAYITELAHKLYTENQLSGTIFGI